MMSSLAKWPVCGNAFWWADRLIRLAQTSQVSLDGQTYSLDHLEERKALAEVIADRMTTLTSSVDQDQFIASLCEALHVPVAALPEEAPIPLLTWAQVQEMQESGLVSFGAHTRHHPDLAQLVSPIEAQSEVGACRAILEQQLRHPMEIFAYPYGHVGDYGLSAAKQAGYTWAV
ncbi:MAG: polysaccharide deacetylase family protein, partial [Chloroflexi bacterium]